MTGGSNENSSMLVSSRRRSLDLMRVKSMDEGLAVLDFEPTKRTRCPDSSSDQDSSNSSPPTSCSSQEKAVKVRTCDHGTVSVIGTF